jgi:hypothetical protein
VGVAENVNQPLLWIIHARISCFKGAENGGTHEVRIADRRQVNKPDSIAKGLRNLGRNREHQARLAGSASTRQGDEPGVRLSEQRGYGGEFFLSSDKGRQRLGHMQGW